MQMCLRCSTFLLILTLSLVTHAQGYPAKTIRLVVPASPGGGSDVISRILVQRMSESMGRQIVIDNRAGANNIIGTDIVARAPPDGYTLVFVAAPHAVNPSMYQNIPFDTLRDFAPISQVATTPYLLVVHPSLPVRTVRELVVLAKARPGQIDYASGGAGGSPHLATELFKSMAGINLTHVPYKGAGLALLDVVSGQVPVMFASSAPSLPYVLAGRLRALGISSTRRSAIEPEIPTVAESGVPDFYADSFFGLLAPARTPRSVIDILNAEAHKAMRIPEVAERMKNLGADVVLGTPADFGRVIESEMKRWGDLVRALNLRVE